MNGYFQVFVCSFFLLISILAAFAVDEIGEGGFPGDGPPEPMTPEERWNNWQKNGGELGTRITYQGTTYPATARYNEDDTYTSLTEPIETPQGSFTGEGMVFDNGNFVSCVSGCNLESGDLTVEGGVGYEGNPESFSVGSVDVLQVGDVRITGGSNLNFDNGVLFAFTTFL